MACCVESCVLIPFYPALQQFLGRTPDQQCYCSLPVVLYPVINDKCILRRKLYNMPSYGYEHWKSYIMHRRLCNTLKMWNYRAITYLWVSFWLLCWKRSECKALVAAGVEIDITVEIPWWPLLVRAIILKNKSVDFLRKFEKILLILAPGC